MNKALKKIVEGVLEREPATRDSDKLLTLKVWALKHPELRNKEFSFVDFSRLFLRENVPSMDNITRTGRKIKEQRPELRGRLYKSRKEKEQVVRKEITLL